MSFSQGMYMIWTFIKVTLQLIVFLWPMWLILLFVVLGRFGLNWLEKQRLSKSGINDIDQMGGKTFEKYLEVLFQKMGYKVHRTRYVGDFGADLVTSKDGIRTIIQAKRFKNNVGIKAIQEAVAAKAYYNCTNAMVVTNSYFTNQAIELARANKVKLWNREDLIKALLSINDQINSLKDTNQKTTESSIGENSSTGVCSLCGRPISEKVQKYCLSNADRFGGKVFCYDHQKTM